MGTLKELAADPQKRAAMVQDAVLTLDQEVADKGGVSGMAIKTAYKMVKGLAPNMISSTVDKLLDDFLNAIQPFYDEAKAQGADVQPFLASRSTQIAEALLAITDARAEKADAGTMKKGYQKLRPTALKHTEAGVPRLAALVAKHAG